MGREDGAIDQMGLVLGQQALESEEQREPTPPLDGGLRGPLLDLHQGSVERPAPGRSWGKSIF